LKIERHSVRQEFSANAHKYLITSMLFAATRGRMSNTELAN